ncbi:MAG: hypothetical protein JKY15_04860 [Deltaproteobacteria bacterium]|nr:hypothetical protein [Deltaproteobacteria bacterium]
MGPVKDFSKKLCIVLEDGDYHCFSTENQSELETHKPQNLPPIEAIYPDSMDTFCALFKTGLFSCWGNNGAYIEDASEIPGIVSANLDTGQVCTLNENHEMKCFRLYDVIM